MSLLLDESNHILFTCSFLLSCIESIARRLELIGRAPKKAAGGNAKRHGASCRCEDHRGVEAEGAHECPLALIPSTFAVGCVIASTAAAGVTSTVTLAVSVSCGIAMGGMWQLRWRMRR